MPRFVRGINHSFSVRRESWMNVRLLSFKGGIMQAKRAGLLVTALSQLPESYIFSVRAAVTYYKVLIEGEDMPRVKRKFICSVISIVEINCAELSFSVYMTVITDAFSVGKPILVTDALTVFTRMKPRCSRLSPK